MTLIIGCFFAFVSVCVAWCILADYQHRKPEPDEHATMHLPPIITSKKTATKYQWWVRK